MPLLRAAYIHVDVCIADSAKRGDRVLRGWICSLSCRRKNSVRRLSTTSGVWCGVWCVASGVSSAPTHTQDFRWVGSQNKRSVLVLHDLNDSTPPLVVDCSTTNWYRARRRIPSVWLPAMSPLGIKTPKDCCGERSRATSGWHGTCPGTARLVQLGA